MGRFHGKGYVMKELQCEKFFDIMKQIQEIRFDAKYEWKSMMNVNATRAVEYLRNHGHDVTFCDKMEALFSQAFDNVMMKIAEPREPLSTLCHGDFTLGNILFKTENDKYDAMLIDFALFYHNALKKYLLEAGVSNIEKYSYEALLDDYRRSGLFGFIIASFYLPIVRGYYTIDIEQLAHVIYVDRGNNAFAFEMKQCGGDEISKILADMLLYLVDLGCLTYF
ncbi:hypothetical protein ALC56_08419 [Trachymyrmex septentrionalis]|uniref:CHK kinase-like domain-containing protein n=1 Tax=Trachymyrmex septentrionalis TaxID=34720 RepID=A0A195F998_9HYME|nr:hypothetical protein ALC56_08419 [Trachymyrmex septentrionalis]